VLIVLFFKFAKEGPFVHDFHSMASLSLRDNNFTGEFVCPTFIDVCHISCIPDLNDTVMEEACRSL
jgi:hypothetical protein